MDNLVLSPLALGNLLRRAHEGEEPQTLLDLCTANAVPVRVEPVPVAGTTDADGCCPCRRPWCAGGCQSDGRLTR